MRKLYLTRYYKYNDLYKIVEIDIVNFEFKGITMLLHLKKKLVISEHFYSNKF